MATLGAPPFLLTPIDNVITPVYTFKFLFFPESKRADVSTMIDTLRHGLAQTLQAIPVLSGTLQVIDQRGSLCVAAPWCTIDDIFQVKDLRHEEGLAYQILRDKQFPLEDMDRATLPPSVRPRGITERSVMFVQVNILKGGIILALGLDHQFTDGNGIPTIAQVWAAYCRGDDGSRLVTKEILDREPLMRGWGSASLTDFPEFAMSPNAEKASLSDILANIYTAVLDWLTSRLPRSSTSTKKSMDHVCPKLENAIFFFPKIKLAELKSMISEMDHVKDGDRWISTLDALSALLGCCIASARDEEIRTRVDKCWVINSALSGRRLLDPPLPPGYIGNFLAFIRICASNQNIDSTPAKVSEVAHLIRDQIKQRGEPYFRGIIAALSSVEDLTKLTLAPISPSEERMWITSWATQDFYDINWGNVVGPRVERVRGRVLRDVPYICVIMPEMRAPYFEDDQCGLEVIVSGLEKEQMARLKQNELFMRFAHWRCN